KEAPNVRIEHPVHLLRHDADRQRIQREMRTALRPESVREPEKVRFVNRVQHCYDGTLDDFVFQRGNAERPLPPVRLRDVRAPHRLRSVRASLQPLRQVPQIRLQVRAVVLPRLTVDARCGVSLDREVGRAQTLDVVHMVEERREPLFSLPSCCLTYTLERARRACPALSPEHVALRRVPLGPRPSLLSLRHSFLSVVRPIRGYYDAVRLPVVVRHRRVSSDFAMRPWSTPRRPRDLPVPKRDASVRDRGLRPRRVRVHLAVVMNARWPSAWLHSVGTLEAKSISRLDTRPTRPPVNASPSPSQAPGA